MCEVVVVPYVASVCCCGDCDTCTVVCVACVCAVRVSACEGDGIAVVGSGGGVVAVKACMSDTRGSGVLSSTCDVLEMSVVRGIDGVCEMCMCLARGRCGWRGG